MSLTRKSAEGSLDSCAQESSRKIRSISLDNIHLVSSTKPNKSHTAAASLSPSGISLKGLKKRFGIKISKSNQDGLEIVPSTDNTKRSQGNVNELSPTYNGGGNLSPKKKERPMLRDAKRHRKSSEGTHAPSQISSSDSVTSRLGVPDVPGQRPRSLTDASEQFILVDASSVDESLDGAGSAYDTGDDVDGSQNIDNEKSKQEIEKLKRKIYKTKELLIDLQTRRDESVKEYLQCAEVESSNSKTKLNFEKRNQKTNQSIQYLQRRLEKYQRILKEEESVSTAHGAKGMLRGMQDAMKAGASSISGKVTRPLESFNHFIKKDKKGGSSENISPTQTTPQQGLDLVGGQSAEEGEKNYRFYVSDEENSSLDSVNQVYPATCQSMEQDSEKDLLKERLEDIAALHNESKLLHGTIHKMEDRIDFLTRSLQDSRYNSERLQCQLNDLINQWNDLTELHQNEISALQMELDRAEERIECVDYRSAERSGEIEEAVDSCVTRINKMELQQQQQQQLLLSVDSYFDGSGNAKLLLSKALSLIISLFAILLVFFSTLARIVSPFCSTRLRSLTSICLLLSMLLLWKQSDNPVIDSFLQTVTSISNLLLERLPGNWNAVDS